MGWQAALSFTPDHTKGDIFASKNNMYGNTCDPKNSLVRDFAIIVIVINLNFNHPEISAE